MRFQESVLRILLAEDDCILATAMEETISSAGHVVIGLASDEHGALQIATAGPPDLALLDLNLASGASGAVVANLIRNLYGTPTLFISGKPDACRKVGMRVGAWGCLRKPFSRATLLLTLDIAEALLARKTLPGSLPEEMELYVTRAA
jgi:DNA-binding response OmpR family regulator